MFDAELVPALKLLRLHTDEDGVLWYGHDALPFESTERTVAAFHRDPCSFDIGLDRAERVRLLGTAENASLIVAMKKFHHDNPRVAGSQEILLGSPHVCPSPDHRASPPTVLQAMWQPGPTATAPGCWHRMGPRDYTTYAIVNELRLTGGHSSEMARRSLRYHPSWPALSFLSCLNEDAACKLIATIIEPRWFRHPVRPSRLSRLNSYLGLTPANMAAFTSGTDGERNFDRAKIVISTWADGFRAQKGSPSGFLHRTAGRAPEGQYHLGLLKACTRFVRFLFEVWTAESTSRPEVAFRPAWFFKTTDEIIAYDAHRKTIRV